MNGPCLCGDPECPRCFPITWEQNRDALRLAEHLDDVCVDAGAMFSGPDMECYHCQLTANPTRGGDIDWRLCVGGTMLVNDPPITAADVDIHVLEAIEDLVAWLRKPSPQPQAE